MLTETSRIARIPRDREGTFDPKLIARYQRRFPGLRREDRVNVRARHDGARDPGPSAGALRHRGFAGPDFDGYRRGAGEVAEWQNRPLEPMYPLVFFDALRVKIRDEGLVRNKAVYVALGVRPDGTKDILGLWIETRRAPNSGCA